MNMLIPAVAFAFGVAFGWLAFKRPELLERAERHISERFSQLWFKIRERIRKWRKGDDTP